MLFVVKKKIGCFVISPPTFLYNNTSERLFIVGVLNGTNKLFEIDKRKFKLSSISNELKYKFFENSTFSKKLLFS